VACAAGRGCTAAQSAALTVIPGVVFSGSFDGALRAYSTTTGECHLVVRHEQDVHAVNGVAGGRRLDRRAGARDRRRHAVRDSGYGSFSAGQGKRPAGIWHRRGKE
jgi:polyvinyl alcohol dehydrogenase (cytochrome)